MALLATVLLMSACGGQHGPTPGTPSHSPAGRLGASAIFGLSVPLPKGAQELAAQAATLRSWRVPLIRLDLAGPVPDDTLDRALRAVRDAGARPVVSIPNTGVDIADLMDQVHQAFPTGLVYLEYSDPDRWNQVAPQLARDGAQLIARVDPSDPSAVAGFVSFAVPRPDFLSWSRYACGPDDSDAHCTAGPASWHTSGDRVTSAVRAAVGQPIPYFFTEWNLDRSADPRYQRKSFVGPWTRQALTALFSLVPDGLAGAMIAAPPGGTLGLIENGQVTAQGEVFREMLSTASPTPAPSGTAGQPSPTGPPPTGTPPRSPSPKPKPVKTHMSFEDGDTDHWVRYWNNDDILTLKTTGDQHVDGSGALLMATKGTKDMAIGCSHGLAGLHPGSRVVYHIWTDGTAKGNVAGFVQDPSRDSHFPRAPMAIPAKAGWFTFSFTVPKVDVSAIGLQLSPTKSGASILLDAVGWSA